MTATLKIRASRHIEKTDSKGRTYYTQGILVSQFPRQDVTIWDRSSDPQYLHAPGVYEADVYFADNSYEKDGKTIRTTRIKFANLRPISD